MTTETTIVCTRYNIIVCKWSVDLSVIHFFQKSTRKYEHSGLILRLILEDTAIKYEPEFNDFEIVLLNLYDIMVKVVNIVPRVETKLYPTWVSQTLLHLDKVKYQSEHCCVYVCVLLLYNVLLDE